LSHGVVWCCEYGTTDGTTVQATVVVYLSCGSRSKRVGLLWETERVPLYVWDSDEVGVVGVRTLGWGRCGTCCLRHGRTTCKGRRQAGAFGLSARVGCFYGCFFGCRGCRGSRRKMLPKSVCMYGRSRCILCSYIWTLSYIDSIDLFFFLSELCVVRFQPLPWRILFFSQWGFSRCSRLITVHSRKSVSGTHRPFPTTVVLRLLL